MLYLLAPALSPDWSGSNGLRAAVPSSGTISATGVTASAWLVGPGVPGSAWLAGPPVGLRIGIVLFGAAAKCVNPLNRSRSIHPRVRLTVCASPHIPIA